MDAVIEFINNILWSYVLIYGLLAIGLFFKLRLGFVQFFSFLKCFEMFRARRERPCWYHSFSSALYQSGLPCGHREYCWRCCGTLFRRSKGSILDVGWAILGMATAMQSRRWLSCTRPGMKRDNSVVGQLSTWPRD